MKQVFSSDLAPEAIGPYSQAVRVENFLYLSGQLGISRETGKLVSKDITEQTHQAFQNVKNVLESAGLDLNDIFSVRVYLTDIGDFGTVNEIYAEYFTEPFPVRAAFAVKSLPAGGSIELEVIAYFNE